jgi:hypothetical protein
MITDLYQHDHFGHLAQITALEANWVEFHLKETDELRWLETHTFTSAYTLIDRGDPIQINLTERRQQAHAQGILVPKEFLTV